MRTWFIGTLLCVAMIGGVFSTSSLGADCSCATCSPDPVFVQFDVRQPVTIVELQKRLRESYDAEKNTLVSEVNFAGVHDDWVAGE
jgi:hypothetical protein